MNKGGSPVFHQDSKTIVADRQQLKSAICAAAISSTHACQIVRQSLVLGNQAQPPSYCQGSIASPPAAPTAYGFTGSIPLLPAMILRLRCGVVNPKRAEIRSTNQAVVAARSGISLRVSARVFVSENTVVALEIVENYTTKFSS